MGTSLLFTGDIAEGRAHYDRAIALYDPVEHRPFATRFGQDISVAILGFRSLALWLLGYPDAALADADCALNDAREIGHAATLMYALNHAAMLTHIHCGNYEAAKAELEELVALADEKGAPFWKALGTINKGCAISPGLAKPRTRSKCSPPGWPHTDQQEQHFIGRNICHIWRGPMRKLGQFDEAWRCIGEAMTAVETTKESWCEAEIHRVAGEIALKSPEPDAAKAEAYFERALALRASSKQNPGNCARR